jgi:hypothetical protein
MRFPRSKLKRSGRDQARIAPRNPAGSFIVLRSIVLDDGSRSILLP